jgi:hypothetical protein
VNAGDGPTPGSWKLPVCPAHSYRYYPISPLAPPQRIDSSSLADFQQRMVKPSGRLAKLGGNCASRAEDCSQRKDATHEIEGWHPGVH